METQEPTDPKELTVYAVRVRPVAVRGIIGAIVHVADTSGKNANVAADYAAAFETEIFTAFGSLATLPFRFPVAPEASHMESPPVRVMPFRFGGLVWRVLYRVCEAGENDGPHVNIVAVRHGAQKPLTRKEGRDIDAENRANR